MASLPLLDPVANTNRSEPPDRGSFALLFSCITTLALFVYTAVHLNIPKQGTTRFQLYWRKAEWVLVGVLAPEFVVYTAWGQWNSARILTASVERIFDDKVINVDFEIRPKTDIDCLARAQEWTAACMDHGS